MIVLGIIDSKPSSGHYSKGWGRYSRAIAEERLCRMKMASGHAASSIQQVMMDSGVTAEDIDIVAVGTESKCFRA